MRAEPRKKNVVRGDEQRGGVIGPLEFGEFLWARPKVRKGPETPN